MYACYVGYYAWFLNIGTKGWDNSNTTNGDRWNQNLSDFIS